MAKRKGKGNINALIRWVGKVGYYACLKGVRGKVTSPEKVCGWLKGRAKKKGVLSKSHKYGRRRKR